MSRKPTTHWTSKLPAPLAAIIQHETEKLRDGAPITPDEWLVATLMTAWRSPNGLMLKFKHKVKVPLPPLLPGELPLGVAKP